MSNPFNSLTNTPPINKIHKIILDASLRQPSPSLYLGNLIEKRTANPQGESNTPPYQEATFLLNHVSRIW